MAPLFKRELQRARNRAEEDRSPENIAALAEAHLQYGEADKALEALREGLESFPYCSQLSDLYAHIQRAQLKGTVRELQEALARSPNPYRYAQLAELYKELGDVNKTLEILTTGIDRFPDSSDLYYRLGEVRLRRFCDDFLVRDGVLAVRHLEKALEVDPVHGQALKLLGRLYLQMGAFARAQHYLTLFVENHPPDEGITSLLELAKERPAEDKDALLEDLLGELADQRRFKVDIGDLSIELAPLSVEFKVATAHADVETLSGSLDQLAALKGFLAAFVYDQEGAHLVHSVKPDLEEAKVAPALSQILENSRDACQRMDVGRFSKGIMTVPTGIITLVSFENAGLAVLWDNSARTAEVEAELDRLVERVLGSSIREAS